MLSTNIFPNSTKKPGEGDKVKNLFSVFEEDINYKQSTVIPFKIIALVNTLSVQTKCTINQPYVTIRFTWL